MPCRFFILRLRVGGATQRSLFDFWRACGTLNIKRCLFAVYGMPYLIDGHNLIACLPDIDLEDPDDEAKLVTKLRGFAAGRGKKCTVIFDGGLPGGHSSMSNKAVKVIFASASHSDADSLIKQRIRKTRDAANWTLVSSDNGVLDCARRGKMKWMRSAEFARRLQRQDRRQDRRGEDDQAQVSPDEVEEWLDIFGCG